MEKIVPFSKEYYLWFWEYALKHVAGWSQTQFEEWLNASDYRAHLEDKHDSLYHEDPIYWIINRITPPELKDERGNVKENLRMGLQIALTEYSEGKIFRNEEDIIQMRSDFERIFSEYSPD